MEDWRVRKTIKEEKAVADAEIEEYQQRQWKAFETSNQEHRKCERYCQEQRQLLCALEHLKAQERGARGVLATDFQVPDWFGS